MNNKYITCHRRGTTSEWANKNNIVPLEGEIVIEIDEENHQHKLKIGDGIHTYEELKYLMAGDEVVTQILAEVKPRIITITLDVDKWTEVTCKTDPNLGYYRQTVDIDAITPYSRLDLQPDIDMFSEFTQLKIGFTTQNENSVIAVYSVGNIPTKSYTMQASIVEVDVAQDKEVIVGTPIGSVASQGTQIQFIIWEADD